MSHQFRYQPETKRRDVPEHERAAFDAEQAIRAVMSMSTPIKPTVAKATSPNPAEMERLLDTIRTLG